MYKLMLFYFVSIIKESWSLLSGYVVLNLKFSIDEEV